MCISWKKEEVCASAVWTNVKIPAKNLIKKIHENWSVKLMPATVWQIFNTKCIQWLEIEIMWICMLKLAYKNSWNHIKISYFWRVWAIWNPLWSSVWEAQLEAFPPRMHRRTEQLSHDTVEALHRIVAQYCVTNVVYIAAIPPLHSNALCNIFVQNFLKIVHSWFYNF